MSRPGEGGGTDEAPEPRGRTLVVFGVLLAAVIVAIIAGAAVLAA